jgi:hypothetical protein
VMGCLVLRDERTNWSARYAAPTNGAADRRSIKVGTVDALVGSRPVCAWSHRRSPLGPSESELHYPSSWAGHWSGGNGIVSRLHRYPSVSVAAPIDRLLSIWSTPTVNQGLGFSSDSLCDKDCSHLAGRCFGAALTPVPRLPLNVFPHGRLEYVWRVSATQQVHLVLLRLLVFPFSMVPLELQRCLVNAAVDA